MHQFDNDMDELFRKAAEKYPLKTEHKNWDDITPFMLEAIAEKPAVESWRKAISILLAIISLFTISMFVLYKNYSGKIDIADRNPSTQLPASAMMENSKSRLSSINKRIKAQDRSADIFNSQKKLKHFSQTGILMANRESFPAILVDNDSVNIKRDLFIQMPDYRITPLSADIKSPGSEIPAINESILTDPKIILAPAAKSHVITSNKRLGIYFGLAAGLQFNQVKGQGFNKPGFSAGLIGGYQFNKKFALETGITWSKNYFFSDGKYFDMSKAGSIMPSNMTVISLNSSNTIIEVPIELKFNIVHNRYSNWFFSAGLSSYILAKERNDYLAMVSGQQEKMQGMYTANKNYFSAAAHFSVGYEHNLRSQTKLRIEPYIQVPLRGIGVGEMQLMTVGFHIGMTTYTSR